MARAVARASVQMAAAPERVRDFLRDCRLHVDESPGGRQEPDQLPSLVATWQVDPSPTGAK